MCEPQFCVLEYRYRDASNFKMHASVLLSGSCRARDSDLIRSTLWCGELFIPEQVGIGPLQHDFEEYSGVPSRDDHVWHEFVALRPASQDEADNLVCAGQKSVLLTAFQNVSRWDERLSEIYPNLMADG
ncbi:MAG: hypothetical protein H7X93_01385 [Sphingomonadaceae bacterium]|nr:hypothetical protein [Sphingomonadaceae bacterium]